jgi:predicted metal-binding membrane protein
MESAALRPAPPQPRLTRVGLTGALLALAATAWVLTGDRMSGMDAAPGTDLGDLGWFAVSWLVMMAVMMLPSLIPATLAFARGGEPRVAAFVVGYFAAWTAGGLVAYLVLEAVRALDVPFLAWDRAGRYVAAGVILAAAGYQLTAAKARCLRRCRTPLSLAARRGREPACGVGCGTARPASAAASG